MSFRKAQMLSRFRAHGSLKRIKLNYLFFKISFSYYNFLCSFPFLCAFHYTSFLYFFQKSARTAHLFTANNKFENYLSALSHCIYSARLLRAHKQIHFQKRTRGVHTRAHTLLLSLCLLTLSISLSVFSIFYISHGRINFRRTSVEINAPAGVYIILPR